MISNYLLYNAFNFPLNINLENIRVVGLFLLTIISGPISYFLNPIGSMLSRKHEYQADEYAVRMIGKPDYLIESLKRLNIDNLSNIYPANIYVWFYYSHPPLFKRIRTLKSIRV